MEAIEPETASIRTEENAMFRSSVLADWIACGGYVLRGMREFRDAVRDSQGTAGVARPQSLLA